MTGQLESGPCGELVWALSTFSSLAVLFVLHPTIMLAVAVVVFLCALWSYDVSNNGSSGVEPVAGKTAGPSRSLGNAADTAAISAITVAQGSYLDQHEHEQDPDAAEEIPITPVTQSNPTLSTLLSPLPPCVAGQPPEEQQDYLLLASYDCIVDEYKVHGRRLPSAMLMFASESSSTMAAVDDGTTGDHASSEEEFTDSDAASCSNSSTSASADISVCSSRVMSATSSFLGRDSSSAMGVPANRDLETIRCKLFKLQDEAEPVSPCHTDGQEAYWHFQAMEAAAAACDLLPSLSTATPLRHFRALEAAAAAEQLPGNSFTLPSPLSSGSSLRMRIKPSGKPACHSWRVEVNQPLQ